VSHAHLEIGGSETIKFSTSAAKPKSNRTIFIIDHVDLVLFFMHMHGEREGFHTTKYLSPSHDLEPPSQRLAGGLAASRRLWWRGVGVAISRQRRWCC